MILGEIFSTLFCHALVSQNSMGLFPVEKLIAGMSVAAEVKDPFGRTLLRSGQQLQERHIELLKGLGIEGITIADSESFERTAAAPEDPDRFNAAALELEPLFRSIDRTWDVMSEIHRSAVLIHLQQNSGGTGKDMNE
jgi:hypothetical protein